MCLHTSVSVGSAGVRYMNLKLREEVKTSNKVMGVINMQLVMESWMCMSSCKKKIYKRRVGQGLLVFKKQTKEGNPLK